MKPDKSQLKLYLQKIRHDLLQKEISCPDETMLTEYFEERLAHKKMEEIRSHVAVCDLCIERIKQIAGTFDATATDALVSSKIIREDWERFEKKIQRESNRWSQTKIILSLAAAVVIIVTAGLTGGFYLTRPDTYSLAQINPQVELKKLDSFRGSDPISQGVFSLKNQDFNRANELFMNYVNENPEHFDGHYYLGLTFLFKAESGLVAFFRFRQTHVEQAIAYLQTAFSLLQDNPRQATNCHWFLGKAYLMKGEIKPAESEFRKILAISEPNIKRKQAAQELLQEIEKLRKRGV